MSLDLPRPYDKAVEIVHNHFGVIEEDPELVRAIAEAIQEPRLIAMNLDNELYWLRFQLQQSPDQDHFEAVVWIGCEIKGLLDQENPDIEKMRAIMAKGLEHIAKLPRRAKPLGA